MLKAVTGADSGWMIYDTSRSSINIVDKGLDATASTGTEATYNTAELDIVSNGFKLRRKSPTSNTVNVKYIYIAFAESPFTYSLAR